jgi:hypothetical protein
MVVEQKKGTCHKRALAMIGKKNLLTKEEYEGLRQVAIRQHHWAEAFRLECILNAMQARG